MGRDPQRQVPRPPDPARRDFLSWLGRGASIALLSPLIDACVSGFQGPGPRDVPGDPASALDGPGSLDEAPGETGLAGCDFAPSPAAGPLYDRWQVNTVDPQDVQKTLATWMLQVDGLVDHPTLFNFCDLRDLGLVRRVADFWCVEGWTVQDVPWDGVPLSVLLDRVGVQAGAAWLQFTSIGGVYTESLSIDVAREPHSLLGLGVDGKTLPLDHGFPCRIVVPRLLGYKNAKYVQHIVVASDDQQGFWERYGYPSSGEVPAAQLRPGHY